MDFYAEWCGPCKTFKPIFESVSTQFEDAEFQKINIDEDSDTSAKYGIRSIPTIILEKDGEIIYRKSGMLSEEDLKSIITQNI